MSNVPATNPATRITFNGPGDLEFFICISSLERDINRHKSDALLKKSFHSFCRLIFAAWKEGSWAFWMEPVAR